MVARCAGMPRFVAPLALFLALALAPGASAAVGALSQPAGTDACVSETGTGGKCADGVGLASPEAVAVSPDGRNVYVAGFTESTIAIFARDQTTGALTETGCQAASSVAGCTTVSEGAVVPDSLAVSGDGKRLYAGSSVGGTVSAFSRDPATGALGPAYCLGYTLFVGCSHATGRALRTTSAVAVAPDSKSVYSTSITDRAVAELGHNDATGNVSQSAAKDGCISFDGTSLWLGKPPDNCTSMFNSPFQTPRAVTVAPDGNTVLVADSSIGLVDFDRSSGGVLSKRLCYGYVFGCSAGHGLKSARDVAVTADGKGVYVASADPGGISVFNRDPMSGSLVAATFTGSNPPSNACINQDASDGCVQGRSVAGALAVVVSPDGQDVYLDGEASGAIAAFARDTTTNQLRQLDGTDGCISYNGSGGLCSQGKVMESIKDLAISPDGKNLYAASQNNQAVLVFDRDTGPAPAPSGGGSAPSGGDGGATSSATGVTSSATGATSSATTTSSGGTQGGAGSAGGDGTPATCTVSVPAVQRKLVKRVLTTTVACDRSATVAETATLTTGAAAKRAKRAKPIALGATSATVGAGAPATVGLKLARRADAALLRAIRRHRRLRVGVSITATAARGATSTAAAAVRKIKLAKEAVSPRSGS
jgi:DNA-binding beta-propeller fold protein YncE